LDRSVQNLIAKVVAIQCSLERKRKENAETKNELLDVQRQDIRRIISDALCNSFETPGPGEHATQESQNFKTRTKPLCPMTSLRRILTSDSTISNVAKGQSAGKRFRSLRFDTIDERYDEISEAHSKTFQWVFKDRPDHQNARWDDYIQWLRSETKIYWINGKAASGKSTLMKYIFDNGQAREILKQWSGSLPLLSPGISSGIVGQLIKNHTMAFRSLLLQVLKARPHLIPLLPRKKESLDTEESESSDAGLEFTFEKSWTLKSQRFIPCSDGPNRRTLQAVSLYRWTR
jgi:hypothetical protein